MKIFYTVVETVNKDDHGADLVKNFRNVQPLNGREVTFFSSMEKIVAPMEPEIKSGGEELVEEEAPSKSKNRLFLVIFIFRTNVGLDRYWSQLCCNSRCWRTCAEKVQRSK